MIVDEKEAIFIIRPETNVENRDRDTREAESG
jgi:hypothetical protein